jgi:bifunctional non-homologous end joining protein LigD
MAKPSGEHPALPRSIVPMRAVTGDLPTSDDGWAYEVKWDGVRAIGFIEDDHVRLQSSNGLDITPRYPELAPIAAELAGHTAILDGEIVMFNDQGRPDFGSLQTRMHLKDARAINELAAQRPVVWVLFDLLHLDGHDLYVRAGARGSNASPALPYEHRRRLLEGLIDAGPNWQVPAAKTGDGGELLRAVADLGMEGLIAKRLGSSYEEGRRSANWRKIKVRRRQEFVVGGWKYGDGGRANTIGALLVGYHTPEGTLAYGGRVGSGFNDAELTRVLGELEPLARTTCPFDPPPTREEALHAHWVEPRLVVEVAFGEWSHDDRLRHPSYLGQRFDKDPTDVVREPL